MPNGEQADTKPSHTENPEIGVPNEDQTEETGHTENPQTDQDQTEELSHPEKPNKDQTEEPGHPEKPNKDQTEEPGHPEKSKSTGPKRAQATTEDGGEAKKQKTTKEAHFLMDKPMHNTSTTCPRATSVNLAADPDRCGRAQGALQDEKHWAKNAHRRGAQAEAAVAALIL